MFNESSIFYFVSMSRFMSDEDRVSMVRSPKIKTETENRAFQTKNKTKTPKFKTETKTCKNGSLYQDSKSREL